MKKSILTILSLSLTSVLLLGCTNTNDTVNTSKNLNVNLNKLSSVVTNLDTIDNNYISNPDIYSNTFNDKNADILVNTSSFNNKYSKIIKLNNTEEETQNYLKEKMNLNNNGYCNKCNYTFECDEYGNCKKCGSYILCDENGNCTYCKSPLEFNDSNTCSTCENSYVSNTICTTNIKPQLVNAEENIGTETINKFEIETDISDALNLEGNTQEEASAVEENIDITNELSTNENNKNNENLNENNENNSTESTQNNTSNVKMYYFTTDSFKPIKLKYNPRYIKQYNETNINEQLSNYLYKVQRLYAMTEDALEANNVLRITKVELLDTINEVKDLNNCIINGECSPTSQQLQAINNYIYDIKTTIKRLKNCNGDLENEMSTINSNIPTSVASSVDVLNSNYMKLINHLDTRITYHESALATLEQIRFLLEDAMNQNNISDNEIVEIIDDLNNTNNNIENFQHEPNNNSNETNETIDNTSELYDNNIDKTTQNEDFEIVVINPNDVTSIESTENTEVVEKEPEINNNLNENIENNNIMDNNTNIEEDNTEVNTDNVDINNNQDSEKKHTSLKNIDTYKPENNDIVDENNNKTDNTNPTQIDDSIDAVPNPANNANPIPNTNNNSFSGSIANENDITQNNTYNNDNLINDGIYKNSVINQNNLNNNDGYGGYYYTNDGEIKNNGTNNNAEYGNNGNTIQNNINRNSNTNTYGYNTLIDIINQGTVNNGINTL